MFRLMYVLFEKKLETLCEYLAKKKKFIKNFNYK